MNNLTYTDKMQAIKIVPAREKFLDLLADYPDFRTAAESIGGEYRDLLGKLWSSLRANLRRDQRWSDYYTSVIELCQQLNIDSISWAPEEIHELIGRIVINRPRYFLMRFYSDPEPVNKRAKPSETLEQQVEFAFMRIVRGMSGFEIWRRFPDEDYDNIRQQISRGARVLGIKLS